MFISLVMILLVYLIPLLVAIGATDSDQSVWFSGYFSYAAKQIGGGWLGVWIVFAAGVSNVVRVVL